MKKICYVLALVIAAVFMFGMSAFAALDITEEEARVLETVKDLMTCESAGDCNLDGGISVADAREALRAVIGLDNMEALQIERADINNDGYLTIEDARLILRIAIGADEQCGHTTEEVVIVPATCTTQGYSIKYCKMCLKKYSEKTGVDPDCHIAIWTTTEPATCLKEGAAQKICTLCGAVTDEKVREKTGHSYSAWEYPDGKDCLNPVKRNRTCKVCGYVQNDILNPTGAHDYFWVHTVKATCLEEGLDEYKCVGCGEVKESKVIPAKGHLYNELNKVEYQKATCTQEGLAAFCCVNCGIPKEGTVETSPALGHVFDYTKFKIITEPTCATQGVATVNCLVCGEAEEYAVEKTAHTFTEEWAETVPVTCTTDGERKAVCKYCGELTEVLPATGHTGVWTVEKAATCAAEGSKTITCTTCGETVTEAIPMKEHTYKNAYDKVTLVPTCVNKGKAVKICSVCGNEEEVTLKVKPDNHTPADTMVEVTPATCTKNATASKVCVDCGAVIGKPVEVKDTATGHSAGTWTTASQPTCTKDGEKVLPCTVCGEAIETEAIPATGHTDTTVTVTFGKDGKGTKTVTCNICGETVETTEFSKIKVTGTGTVTFTDETTFVAGTTVSFTIEGNDAIAGVSVFYAGIEEGVEITEEGGVYSFDIPEGLAENEVITISIYTDLG